MKVDRRYRRIKKQTLLAFAKKVIRNGANNEILKYPEDIVGAVNSSIEKMTLLFSTGNPVPKDLISRIRAEEVEMKRLLNLLADHCDKLNLSKYDLYKTGFPAVSERISEKVNRGN